MPKNAIIAVIVALVVAIGGAYVAMHPSASMPDYAADPGTSVPPATDSAANASSTDASASVGVTVGTPAVITLTDAGFSPSKVVVKAGQSVTFVNQSKNGMWIGSDEHPTHTDYSGTSRSAHCPDTDGTAFDQCTVGDSYTFTFTKAGTWGFHDHVAPNFTGTVVVTD